MVDAVLWLPFLGDNIKKAVVKLITAAFLFSIFKKQYYLLSAIYFKISLETLSGLNPNF